MIFPTRNNLDLVNIHELVCIVSALNRAFALCSNMETPIDYFNSVFHNFYFNVITFSLGKLRRSILLYCLSVVFKKTHQFWLMNTNQLHMIKFHYPIPIWEFYLPLFLFFCHYLSLLRFHFFSQVATIELHTDVKSTSPFEKGSAPLNLLSFIFVSECKFTEIA